MDLKYILYLISQCNVVVTQAIVAYAAAGSQAD